MFRWLLLLLSAILAAVAALTCVPAPTLTGWKVAILAGEFGQFLVWLPLALGVAVLMRGGRSGWPRWTTLVLCGVAVVGFARPTAEAWWIGQSLQERCVRAFGPAATVDAPAFSAERYVSGSPIHGKARTYVYAEGQAPLRLDFYRPDAPGPVPCIVLIHGGGWDSGQREELPAVDAFLAEHGYAVAAIDYRLAPRYRWPAQADDVEQALGYLKVHARDLGIDPHRFVLLGRSAGGQIAIAMAYEQHDPDIRGVISFYAPHDLRFAWAYAKEDDILDSPRLMRQLTGGTPETAATMFDAASGIGHVSPSVPPTLLVHGALDTLVWHKQSERLNAVLAREGVAHLFVSLPWATHAFDYNLDGPGGQIACASVLAFLRAETR